MEQIQPIENMPIKGFSIRNLIIVIVATATTVTSVIMSSNRLSGQIIAVDNKVEMVKMGTQNDGKLNDLRMKIMERRLDIMDEAINNLKNKK